MAPVCVSKEEKFYPTALIYLPPRKIICFVDRFRSVYVITEAPNKIKIQKDTG